jgi:hypothetical protein
MTQNLYREGRDVVEKDISALEFFWEAQKCVDVEDRKYNTVGDLLGDLHPQTAESLLDDPGDARPAEEAFYVREGRLERLIEDLEREIDRYEELEEAGVLDEERQQFQAMYDKFDLHVAYDDINSRGSAYDIQKKAEEQLKDFKIPKTPVPVNSEIVSSLRKLEPKGTSSGAIIALMGAASAAYAPLGVSLALTIGGSATALASVAGHYWAEEDGDFVPSKQREVDTNLQREALEKRLDEEYSKQAVERLDKKYGDMPIRLTDEEEAWLEGTPVSMEAVAEELSDGTEAEA